MASTIGRYRLTPISAAHEADLDALVSAFLKGAKYNAKDVADALGVGFGVGKLLLEEARIVLAEDHNEFLHIGYQAPHLAFIVTGPTAPGNVARSLRPYAGNAQTYTTHLPILAKVGLPIMGVGPRTKESTGIMANLTGAATQEELGIDGLKIVIARNL